MAKDLKTTDEFLIYFRRICDINTQKAIALYIGISPQYINDLYHGRRELTQLGEQHLKKLGFECVQSFKQVGFKFDDSDYEKMMKWRESGFLSKWNPPTKQPRVHN